jgi:hypothetical protein
MFIAAIFTIASYGNNPTTDEWVKQMWYIYTMEFYSVIKKNDYRWFES